MGTKTTRKKLRTLAWNNGSVERYADNSRRLFADILIQLDDIDEPDRYVRLDLTDDEAVRLAARLAHHTGYKLVEQ